MNQRIRVITCLPLLFFSMIPIVASTVPLQDKSLQENNIDPAYRDDADDDRETQLKKERIRSAMFELEQKLKRVNEGQDQVLIQLECQRRLVAALLDFHKEPSEIISLLEKNVEAAKVTEANRKLRYENGVERPDDLAQATYFRADAELQLLRAQKKYNVDDGDLLNLPVPQLETLTQDNRDELNRFRDELSKNLSDPGKFYSPELKPLLDGTEQQTPQNNLIDEWTNGKFSPAPYKINRGDDEETRLKKQRINVALMEKDHFTQIQAAGVTTLEVAFESQNRLLEAQLDFLTDPKEIVSALQQAFESAKQVEAIVRDQYNGGAHVNTQQVAEATGNRLAVEIKWLRAKKTYGLLLDSAEYDKDVEAGLMQQRIDSALTEIEHFNRLTDAGVETFDAANESWHRLLDAQLDFHTKPEEIVSELQQALKFAKQTEAIVRDQFRAGTGVNIQQIAEATGNRLALEIKLLRANKKYGLLEDSAEKDQDVEAGLMQQRIDSALTEIEHFKQLSDAGSVAAIESQHRLLDAQLDFYADPKEIVSALQQAFESAKQTEEIVRDQFKQGAAVNIQQVGQATYNRLDCEIKLLRAK